jgi:hypothetical protein
VNKENKAVLLGPVPAKRGTALKLHFSQAPESVDLKVYNSAGELVSTLKGSVTATEALQTGNLGAGIYYLKGKVKLAGGGEQDADQRFILLP